MRVHLTKAATRQLRAIFAHIAAENPQAAQRIVARVEEIREMLSRNPDIGYRLPRGRLRRFPLRTFPYLIYFEVAGETVRIVRVRHSARYRKAFHDPDRVFVR